MNERIPDVIHTSGPILDADTLTIEEKIGQLVIARYLDHDAVEPYARKGLISGMTPQLSDRTPEEAAEFINHFQSVSKYPLLFGWSGICYRGGTDLKLWELMRIAATRSKELAYLAGKIEAQEARAVGFQLGGSPVLDVNTNPDNPIINLRAFSDNTELVIALGQELIRGMNDGGALPVCMHFPGHGATGCDSHIAIPIVERTVEELETVDLVPFRAVIESGLARLICTNHCHYPAWEPNRVIPATISRRIVTGLLRERLGYDGLIISDSLTMKAIKDPYGIEEAAIETVLAGHDLILQDYQSDPGITLEALVKAARDRRIPVEQIDASVARVLKAKQELGLFDKRLVQVGQVQNRLATSASKEVAKRVARESVTVLENQSLPLRRGNEGACILISNGSVATIEEDLSIEHIPANELLFRRLRDRLPTTRQITLPMDMSPEDTESAFEVARSADIVVFGLFSRVRAYAEEGIRLPKEYRELIRRVIAAGRHVVYLNFGNPWSVDDLPKPAVALSAFSDAHDSIEASLEVLFGEIAAKGKLPVTLKDYPFGHGL